MIDPVLVAASFSTISLIIFKTLELDLKKFLKAFKNLVPRVYIKIRKLLSDPCKNCPIYKESGQWVVFERTWYLVSSTFVRASPLVLSM
jgi:hypothetical protein